MSRGPNRVAIIGGGIAGLSAAWEFTRASNRPAITLFEADRLGGKLQSSTFAGLPFVDEAADAFLARVPWGRQLCSDLGITDLVSPATGRAYVWQRDRLHPIPDGLVLGVPAGLGGLVRSRLLSPWGVARAGLDLVIPRTPPDHDSLGRLIRDRFGDEVAERLVDPLVGSINAGDADTLSLDASAPQIAEPAKSGRSLLLALRRHRATTTDGPVFLTPRKGLGWMAATLVERLRGLEVDFRVGAGVTELVRVGSTWRVDGEEFDSVVLATPADVSARLLRVASPEAAKALIGIPYAGVVMVALHLDHPAGPIGSGYLVPKPVQQHVTATSLSTYKWTHWAPPAGGSVLRVSLGRYGNQAPMEFSDDEVLRVAVDEVSRHLDTELTPVAHRITRWPRSFPQYLPHHLDRVAAIDAALARDCPRLVVAGAAYRGVGVPACIRQGREAARSLL